jgi:hypothetical protein
MEVTNFLSLTGSLLNYTDEVWMYFKIRSNHKRIVQLTGKSDAEIEQQKDSPLKLKSTENWRKKGNVRISREVQIWLPLPLRNH